MTSKIIPEKFWNSGASMFTSEQLEIMSFRELQNVCKTNNLSASGKRADLVFRILSMRALLSETDGMSNVNIESDLSATNISTSKVRVHHALLSETERRRLRAERFGISPIAMNITSNPYGVSELQKLSQRAARFGISSSDRAF